MQTVNLNFALAGPKLLDISTPGTIDCNTISDTKPKTIRASTEPAPTLPKNSDSATESETKSDREAIAQAFYVAVDRKKDWEAARIDANGSRRDHELAPDSESEGIPLRIPHSVSF